MKKNWTNILLCIVFMVVSTLLLAALSKALSSDKPADTFGKAEVAYWVQAIMAFTTIFVAIYVLRKQGEHSANLMIEADERTLRRKVYSIGGILDEACRQLAAVADDLLGTLARELNLKNGIPDQPLDDRMYVLIAVTSYKGKPRFENILRVIDAIPLHETGSQAMVQAIFELREALVEMDRHLAYASRQTEEQIESGPLINAAYVWRSTVLNAKQSFDRAATELFSG